MTEMGNGVAQSEPKDPGLRDVMRVGLVPRATHASSILNKRLLPHQLLPAVVVRKLSGFNLLIEC